MNKRQFLKAILYLICLSQVLHNCQALELDKAFTQKLDQDFFLQMQNNPCRERAIFFQDRKTKKDILFFVSYENGTFALRGSLPKKLDQTISHILAGETTGRYSPLKKDGSPLYEHGSCFLFRYNEAECLYVPFYTPDGHNDCFVSDLGYFEARFSAKTINASQLCQGLISWLTEQKLVFAKKVKLNRYYLFRDNYFGPVHFYYPDSIKAAKDLSQFMPVHKLTMNKHIADWQKKSSLDLKFVDKIMVEKRFLLSQDQRLKLGMVPAFVKLNWERIKETDIGSGQNQLVFLSIGPGINYFDDPWEQARKNIPCPRLIFDNSLYGFKQLQIYPTFSIEPEAIGEGRLAAINHFQANAAISTTVEQRKPVWLPPENRKQVINSIEQGLCDYNLLNDSSELRPGFKLMNKEFNGNIINNEIRIKDAISPMELMRAVIVPPDSRHDYISRYISSYRDSSPHWQYICATRFTDMFIEAPTPDDKGFRAAWLKWHLSFSHPTLERLLNLAEGKNKPQLPIFIAEKIARLIEKEGLSFFKTPYAKHKAEIESKRLELWCHYLQAYRNQNPEAKNLLTKFITLYHPNAH